MCQVNGRWSFSATWGSETPEPIHLKSGMCDYVLELGMIINNNNNNNRISIAQYGSNFTGAGGRSDQRSQKILLSEQEKLSLD